MILESPAQKTKWDSSFSSTKDFAKHLCVPIEIEQREPEEKRASETEIGETTLEYLEQVVTCCISSGDLILAGIGKKHMWWV